VYRFKIKGVVQGVGFRPYIYNACTETGLCGFVQNTGDGVIVEVDDKEQFEKLLKKAPENSNIESYEVEEIDVEHGSFTIKKTEGTGYSEIPPDFYICDDCVADMNDETNRRHNYFFTTCTNCGPRFSTTRSAPYDRDTTSMDYFPMCKECKLEYENPKDRRYHAQTIACHNCGPKLTLYKNDEIIAQNVTQDSVQNTSNRNGWTAPVEETAELIKRGEIVAIKGIGGFHLVCNTNPETVAKLKKLTGRTDKPFALMCKDIETARSLSSARAKEEEILLSKERPIVLVKKGNLARRELSHVSELDTIGIMLPYSALHYLLFKHIDEPLVMTSSNFSDEPISTKKESQISEYVLDHDREITNATDDSVVKVINEKPFFVRRSRGFVPESIKAPVGEKNILAVGAELNNTFAIYNKVGRITPSQYMGTTSNVKTLERYKESVHAFLNYTNAKPDLIVSDLHPNYNTTRFAETLSEELQVPIKRVQHHKAHAYGVALENNLSDFVAIVSDGLGYGDDGNIWGGEIFVNDERVGHLEEQIQLGGDSAARFPSKMLFGILRKFMDTLEVEKYMRKAFPPDVLALLNKQLQEKYNSPTTTSTGRVLDAVSFLLGFCDERTYDGRPAMLLEANSSKPYEIEPTIQNNVLMTTPLFEYLIENFHKDKKRLAGTAELYIAKGLFEIAKQYKKSIIWSGGVAYNKIMTEFMMENEVLTHNKIPPGDGGISFGQIAYVLANG
jgi:hydrogenase maturation protein HypF